MKPHAFVAMPFGKKTDHDGEFIDFNAVYEDLLKPAAEAAGLSVFRADEELAAGDIKTDMFQELLIADLVIVDLTLDNANVWYELGVCHALRARGVVLVQGPRANQPFDIYTDRKYNYGIKNGVPDPATLEQDKAKIAKMVKAILEFWHGRKISPVYQLLPSLEEPQWQALRVGNVLEFWQAHDAWERRIDLARRCGHIGDIFVLADEAPIAAFRAEARIKAGIALRKAEHFDFALEQLEQGLAVDPVNIAGQREKGICLQRLAVQGKPRYSLEKARDHYRNLLKSHPNDSETLALLGRVDKDAWTDSWRHNDWSTEQKREEAAYQKPLLRAAIDSYRQAFRRNLGHYYSGINALTLMHVYRDLTGDSHYDVEAQTMNGTARFSVDCETEPNQQFWAKATLGDVEVLAGTPETVTAAYQKAIAKAEKDWFALNSTLAQLRFLQDLDFRSDCVAAGIKAFERALQRLRPPERQPRQILLFSGHMIDAPGRATPRFPQAKVPQAEAAIAKVLDQLGVGPEDLAFTQGASGGDLIFAEACLARGAKLQLLQPFPEPDFIERSVAPSAGDWRSRYYAVKAKLAPERPPRCMTKELGESERDPYERCNLWLLNTALGYGPEKVRFVCLWDGGDGDGPGGTRHMVEEVKKRTGQVVWLDTRELG
jgi:tetratricopeptide (TPR) repeat protein